MKLFHAALVLLSFCTSFVSFADHGDAKSVIVNPEAEVLNPNSLRDLSTEQMLEATANELKADDSRMMKIAASPKNPKSSFFKAATTAADILYNMTLAARARYSLQIYLKELNRRLRAFADELKVDSANGKKLKALTAQIEEAERAVEAAEYEISKVKEQLRTANPEQETGLNVQLEGFSIVLKKHQERLAKLNAEMGAMVMELSRRQNSQMNLLADYIKDIKIRLNGGAKNPHEPEIYGWNEIIEKSKKDLLRVFADKNDPRGGRALPN